MKLAAIVFPGSNYDADTLWAVREIMGADAKFVRHDGSPLEEFDEVLLPGGSSYDDCLRCGVIVQSFVIMEEVIRFVKEGRPVFGTCNGSQILTEAGPLPGVLRRNESLHFICKIIPLRINPKMVFASEYETDGIIYLPVARGEGNYFCDEEVLQELERNNQVALTYNDSVNGNVENIAGITNKAGDVLGMIPHPERTVENLLGSGDGKRFFASILKSFGKVTV